MDIKCQVLIVLDKRRKKKNDTYPVKLRVYHNNQDKRYTTGKDLTLKDFKNIFTLNLNIRGENRNIASFLFSLKNKAESVIEDMAIFNYETFEKKMFRTSNEASKLTYHYNEKIKALIQNEQIKTASSYQMSLNSLLSFSKYLKVTKTDILFSEVTVDFLQKYEKYMVNVLDRSISTVGIYLRPLRSVFNAAIDNGDVQKEYYPFGKNKYEIPSSQKVKKALNKEQLKTFFECEAKTPEQRRAKDFWFFSYSCNGMNLKDIALLKNEDLQDDKLIFFRAKTKNTSKTKLRPVVVYLTDYAQLVIEKFRSNSTKPKDYVFPILCKDDDAIVRNNKVQNFVRFVNQHVKKIASDNNLPKEISTYWARHSFATNAIRSGASMEFVSEALSHNNVKTTQGYFAGFDDDQKRDIAKSIMEF